MSAETSTRHFTQALAIVHNAATAVSDPALRSQAEQYLLQLQQSPVGLDLAIHILTNETPDDFRCFWACQTCAAHYVPMATAMQGGGTYHVDPGTVYRTLLNWLRRLLDAHGHGILDLGGKAALWVLNKHAHTMVTGLFYFYPDRFGTFFDDMFSLVDPHFVPGTHPSQARPISLITGNTASIRYFLRVYQEIHEVVVDPGESLRSQPYYRQRSTIIKDAMREVAVRRVVDVWFCVLTQFGAAAIPPNATLQTGETFLALNHHALANVQAYVDWTEVSLFLEDRWINLIYYLMSQPQVRVQACECLVQLTAKKQLPAPKLQTIGALRLGEILPKLVPVVAVMPTSDEAVEFHLSACRFIVGAADELVTCLTSAAPHMATDPAAAEVGAVAERYLHELIPHIINLTSVPLYMTREIVSPFLNNYIKTPNITMGEAEQLVSAIFLQTCHQPLGSCGQDEEDDPQLRETRIVEQRKLLHNILRIMYKKNSNLVLRHVQSVVDAVISADGRSAPFRAAEEVEGVLRYLFELSEAIRFDGHRLQTQVEVQATATFLVRFLNSPLLDGHPSPIVHMALFELYDRYYPLFIAAREHVPTLLRHFLSSANGIRNPNSKVRARICYLFSHTVTLLKKEYAQYGEEITKAVVEHIASDNAYVACTERGAAAAMVALANANAALAASNSASTNASIAATTAVGATTMSAKEKCDLYEALGVLLASSNQLQLCGNVSQIVLTHLAASVATLAMHPTQLAEVAALLIADDISFVTALIKGVGVLDASKLPDSPQLTALLGLGDASAVVAGHFPPMQLPAAEVGPNGSGGVGGVPGTAAGGSQVHPIFHVITQQVLQAASAVVTHMTARERTLEYMQQVINVIGVEALPYVEQVLVGFLQHPPPAALSIIEVPRIIRVALQCVNKTKGHSANLMGGVLLPALVQRVVQLGSPAELTLVLNVQSESQRELTEVYKALFGWIYALVTSSTSIGALYHANMIPLLPTVMGSIFVSALRVPVESELPKLCLQILCRLAAAWATPGSEMLNYLLATILPSVFDVLTTPTLVSAADARGFLVMGEAMLLLRCTMAKGTIDIVGPRFYEMLSPLCARAELDDIFSKLRCETGDGMMTSVQASLGLPPPPAVQLNVLRLAFKTFVELLQSRRQQQQGAVA